MLDINHYHSSNGVTLLIRKIDTSVLSFGIFRLSFSLPFKCKLWQERVLESLKRLCREPKSEFAFVHRAYNKDKRMAREDLLRLGVAEAKGVVVWEEQDGADTLISLKGK